MPGHEIRGEASVEWAIDAIELFNDLIGPYPYQQFSIVDAVIGGGAAGIEFPQIVYIASDYYDDPLDDEYLPHGQEYTLVHEVIHQWFYALVGNNQNRYAFLDESLTNYLSVVYFEKVYDEDVALQQALLNIIAPYVIYLWGMPSGPSVDEPVNTATDAFSSGTAYGVIIYNKGPLAFQAIREAIGDEPFFDAIASYFRDQQLLIAQPDDLENAFAARSAIRSRFRGTLAALDRGSERRGRFPARIARQRTDGVARWLISVVFVRGRCERDITNQLCRCPGSTGSMVASTDLARSRGRLGDPVRADYPCLPGDRVVDIPAHLRQAPLYPAQRPDSFFPDNPGLDGWVRWDSAHLIELARAGYGSGNTSPGEGWGFFPLYSLLMRGMVEATFCR
ncbi:MAG: M1 family aminopeptidase [Thermomicrobiales bacterium]